MSTTTTRIDGPDSPSVRAGCDGSGRMHPRWEAAALAAILVLTLALRLWRLEQNGWGAEYYTAAVRSMALTWHNFFYCAFDPAGFISVDKPPIALWLQVASVKLLGYHPLGVLAPQVLEGTASVGLLFGLVRRRFGASAALLASLFLAVTPVFVAVNRTNNTDSCLVLALLVAAWPLMKAAEEGSRPRLLVSMALLGFAFNVKMLAGYIVVPTFLLVYFVGAPRKWQRRIADLAMAAVVLAATSLPWVLAVELTPAEGRPYVGGSSRNSVFELIGGYNGIGRFVSQIRQPQAEGVTGNGAPGEETDTVRPPGRMPPEGWRPPEVLSRLFVRTPAGPLRLADGQLAAQVGWLLPLAAAALLAAPLRRGVRRPPAPENLALLFWVSWIVTYAAVYSSAGGIMHFYYLATLAPAVAALAGIGFVALFDRYRGQNSRSLLLPAALLVTAFWEIAIEANGLGWTAGTLRERAGDWLGFLHAASIAGTVVSAAGLLIVPRFPRSGRRVFSTIAGTTGLAALLVMPLAWALSSVLVPGPGTLPSADLLRLDPASRADARILERFGRTVDTTKLVGFLKANRNGERWLLATSTAQLAAPIIIATGEAVMARGGFHGLDPAIRQERLAQLAGANEIRFVMLGDVAHVSRRMGGGAAGKQVADWVRANGTPVDPALWRSARRRGGPELYDLRPAVPLLPGPSTPRPSE